MKRLYSSRLAWETPPNRLSELRSRVSGYLDLTVSNPTQAGIVYPESAILRALADPRALRYEPTPLGLDAAREAVASYYGGIDPERVLLTASTSEAYAMLFKLFCDPGDNVLIPSPSYPLFDYLAALECVATRPYSLQFDGVRWSVDRVDPDERTRAIVAVSPNNPTGSCLDAADLARLDAAGLPVILDEVFRDYARSDAGRAPDNGDVWRLNGLSKLAGLPQLKLGWIVCPSRVPAELELIADTYLSVGAPVQYALPELLSSSDAVRQQIRGRCASNEALLRDRLRGTAGTPLPVEGGWTVPVEVPRTRSEEDWACHLLEHHGVLVQPGYFYDFAREAYLVVSLLTPEDDFARGVEAMVSLLG